MRMLLVCSVLSIVTYSGSSENEEDRVETIEMNDFPAAEERSEKLQVKKSIIHDSGDRISLAPRPFRWSDRPYGMREGRLRLDFSRPGLNGSYSNFRGSAELVTGSWGLNQPEVAGDWLPVTIAEEPEPTTTSKKVGFFKGIQDFFRNSFHAGNTTPPLRSTTAIPIVDPRFLGIQLQPPLTPFQSREKPLLEGHDATFNLRIKAVAIPQPLRGIPLKGLKSLKNVGETGLLRAKRRPSFDIGKRRFRRVKKHGIY